jgi:hypothetical protein
MTYETKEYSIATSILEDGRQLALVSNKDAARVVAALKLYDTLKLEFGGILAKTDKAVEGFDSGTIDWEEGFIDYIGIGSSWIIKLGYNQATGRMKVVKKDSTIAPEVVMIYKAVPEQIFKRVLKPDAEFKFSVGAAFNGLIRGKYELES